MVSQTLHDSGQINTPLSAEREDISFTKETRLNLRDHVFNFIIHSSFVTCRGFLPAS